jgi:hypothetical protein
MMRTSVKILKAVIAHSSKTVLSQDPFTASLMEFNETAVNFERGKQQEEI